MRPFKIPKDLGPPLSTRQLIRKYGLTVSQVRKVKQWLRKTLKP